MQVVQTAGQEQCATTQKQSLNLFVSVKTFDKDGRPVGERVVDMYHHGTRNWLASHTWWAMHNGHSLEQALATDEEVDNYLANAKKALAEKFAA